MKPNLFSIFICFAAACIFPTFSQADPLTDTQADQLLQELDTIQDALDGNRIALRKSAVSAFTAASQNDKAAYEFYLQCHKTLKFDARDATFSEFRDWRDKNENKVKTPENLMAMRMQLQYLVLTMKAAEGVEREFIIPELEKFTGTVVSHAKDLGNNGMKTLRSSVKSTIFAAAYDLNKSLDVNNWNFSPGDFAATYEKSIFPYIRETSPATLGAMWDRRINLEKTYTTALQGENELAMEKFQTERIPRLYWTKAKDIFANVSQREGAASMLNIIRAQPTHPDLQRWVKDLRDTLLKSREESQSTPPQTTTPATSGGSPQPIANTFDN